MQHARGCVVTGDNDTVRSAQSGIHRDSTKRGPETKTSIALQVARKTDLQCSPKKRKMKVQLMGN